jgi:uridylate kinase
MGKQGTSGIYDSDPRKNKDAVKYDEISYQEVLAKGLQVMDTTATALCKDNNIPLVVFDMMGEGYVVKVVRGENVGQTLVRGDI